jgi:ABC-type nitrate/sulfonate/bicarbonate transport system substrate-binding protein
MGMSVSALAAACAPAASPPSTGPLPGVGVTPPPTPLTTIRFGIPSALFELLYPRAAQDAGIYATAGLNIDFVETPGDPVLTPGLVAGEFLVTRQGPQAVLTAVAQGTDIVIVAAPHTRLPFVFVAQEGFDSLESLYGQPVGSNGPGAFLANVIDALYRLKGLDPTRLEYVNTGSTAQAVTALAARKITGSLLLYTDLASLAKSGARTVQLADIAQELPNYLRQILAVSRRSLTEQDARLRTFFVTHSRAYRWALNNKEAIVQAAMKYQNRDLAEAESNFDILLRPGLVTPDFGFTEEQIRYLQELNITVGGQKEVLPFNRVADLRYVQAVAQELGPYTPPSNASS